MTIPSGPGQTTKANSRSIALASDSDALPVRLVDHSADATFAGLIWVGVPGGAALSTDPDPNVTPPIANRIMTWSAIRGGLMTMGAGPANGALTQVIAVGGTQATVQMWFYDDTQAKWVKHGGIQTVVSAAGNVGTGSQSFSHNIMGAKIFFQITANTGVEALGFSFR
jgi:hypothetical protein